MRCPFCSFDSTRVVDSRLTDPGDAIRRRRECAQCGNRFTTYERAEAVPIDVVKRDGTTQRFDRRKLLRGLVRAAGGRPVGGEQLEELADSIEAQARKASVDRQIRADLIGDLAEKGLARLDPVTAIQFASVYRRLADLDELEAVVRKLRDEPDPGVDQMPFEGISTSDAPGNIASPAERPGGHKNRLEERS
jgi:transcriptional repressor NrdR